MPDDRTEGVARGIFCKRGPYVVGSIPPETLLPSGSHRFQEERLAGASTSSSSIAGSEACARRLTARTLLNTLALVLSVV